MSGKQAKVSIPSDEMALAREQAKRDGWLNPDGTVNVTGWIRWVIRKNATPQTAASEA